MLITASMLLSAIGKTSAVPTRMSSGQKHDGQQQQQRHASRLQWELIILGVVVFFALYVTALTYWYK